MTSFTSHSQFKKICHCSLFFTLNLAVFLRTDLKYQQSIAACNNDSKAFQASVAKGLIKYSISINTKQIQFKRFIITKTSPIVYGRETVCS